jgi:uncharacterized protein YacL
MSMEPNTHSTGNTFSIIAIVLGALSLLFLPIVFGPIAIVLAIIGKSKKEKLSTVALVIGIIGTVIGMIIGAIVGVSMFS